MNVLPFVVLVCVVTVSQCRPSGGVHHKQPDGYFMYLNVPRPKEYEAGFNRGNDKHHISRFDQVKDHRFRTRVKWHDAKDGYGEHYYEYNHAPKHPEHYHQHGHHQPYHEPPKYEVIHDPHAGLYSQQEPVFLGSPGLKRTTFDEIKEKAKGT